MESLRTLVFIEQDRPYVELHVRTPEGFLIRSFHELSDRIEFGDFGFSIGMSEIYDGLSIASR
jgi:hypothetical protein